MNAGFLYVSDRYPDQFDCFIFHDVDLLLENELGLYKCSSQGQFLANFIFWKSRQKFKNDPKKANFRATCQVQ